MLNNLPLNVAANVQIQLLYQCKEAPIMSNDAFKHPKIIMPKYIKF